ncbi:MAG: NADH dehydrogenase ubiquinone Fe-S protein 4 [Holosporales bacterium]
MKAKLYQPARTAMQQGKARTKGWILEVETHEDYIESTMQWRGSRTTQNQVRLKFATKEAAEAYAKSRGLELEILSARVPTLKPKSYADNFIYNRVPR